MNEEQQQMVEDCEKRSAYLTDWEAGFIDSLQHRMGRGLTDRQEDQLNRIWNRVSELPA